MGFYTKKKKHYINFFTEIRLKINFNIIFNIICNEFLFQIMPRILKAHIFSSNIEIKVLPITIIVLQNWGS